MGRQVRRVATDFAWPLKIPYEGFVMPARLRPTGCRICEGMGWSPEGRIMHDRWWGKVTFDPRENGSEPFTIDTPGVLEYARRKIVDSRAFYDDFLGSRGDETARREAWRMCNLWNGMWQHHLSQEDVDAVLASDQVLEGLTHEWLDDPRGWTRIDREQPTQQEVNLWSLGLTAPLRHLPQGIVQNAHAERHGLPTICASCDGEGTAFRDDGHRTAHDDWKPAEPPAGPGWQMWETVSEGSPVSSVYATAEDLARHMADGDVHQDDGMGYEGWLRFIVGPGWAPSAIGPMSGPAATTMMTETMG